MPAILDKIADALHLTKDKSQRKTPEFDHAKVIVIFVLGGPGAGKGTQCTKLVQDFGFCHLSAGDLLRAEQHREGSEFGEFIQTCIREGNIVPMEVTVKLLENAMTAALAEGRSGDGWANGHGRFLVDGFPRKMDQAIKFDEDVCMASMVLFFSTTEQVMLARLLERGKTSGREDDNAESIKKRFNTYKETTMPVIKHYEVLGKVAEVCENCSAFTLSAHPRLQIDSSPPVDEVYQKTKAAVEKILKK
ncbi:UMP-CMP kinase [Mycena crocata]|nr:UMP-CMP kinase [Mycena crocata]